MHFFTRYCSECLKKFCPRFEESQTDSVQFFVPTIDELERNMFIFIDMKKSMAFKLFSDNEKKIIDITQYAKILHIEEGDWPTIERSQEIRNFHSPVFSTNVNEMFVENFAAAVN